MPRDQHLAALLGASRRECSPDCRHGFSAVARAASAQAFRLQRAGNGLA
jgi:hypothetical protein